MPRILAKGALPIDERQRTTFRPGMGTAGRRTQVAVASGGRVAYVEGNTAGSQNYYWSEPGFTHPDPHKIGVTFTNDYVRNEDGVRICDRNLLVDKLIVDTSPYGL